MQLPVDAEFLGLCQSIVSDPRSLADWRATESDDEFRTDHFAGGFDATESAFCFSYYDADRKEWWFQLTPDQVRDVAAGRLLELSAREAV